MFGQFCLANQFQRDLDSERMTRMQRQLFEDGRHRGHDPFGYRSLRDPAGYLVRGPQDGASGSSEQPRGADRQEAGAGAFPLPVTILAGRSVNAVDLRAVDRSILDAEP